MVKCMGKTHYIIPVFVPDLGCPHQCVFCNQKKITGSLEVPTKKDVAGKIADYLQSIPRKPGIVREVAFYGGSFTAVSHDLQAELLKPAYQCKYNGEIDKIRISTRPDAISEDIMVLLSAYGVDIVELGVQSMDDEVLWLAGRGHSSRDVLRASAMIKSWGMTLGLQLMVGLPGGTGNREITTAAEVIALKPDFFRIYPCLVLKDTPLADLYLNGKYQPLSVEKAVERCKLLLVMFEKAGIPVIRIGLQPSEQISLTGDVIAGPYHPAFRELVEAAVARDQLEYLLQIQLGITKAYRVELSVPATEVSIVRGHKGSNVQYFREKYGISEFITIPDPDLKPDTLKLQSVDGAAYNRLVTRHDLPGPGCC